MGRQGARACKAQVCESGGTLHDYLQEFDENGTIAETPVIGKLAWARQCAFRQAGVWQPMGQVVSVQMLTQSLHLDTMGRSVAEAGFLLSAWLRPAIRRRVQAPPSLKQ